MNKFQINPKTYLNNKLIYDILINDIFYYSLQFFILKGDYVGLITNIKNNLFHFQKKVKHSEQIMGKSMTPT